jgi:arylformamidase
MNRTPNGGSNSPSADTRWPMANARFQDSHVIDLTLTLRAGMRGVAFEPKFNFKEHGWNAQTLHLYSHCGTHMDAPTHFAAGPRTIEVTPLERCTGWAWVVNLDGITDKALVTVAHLGNVAPKFQPGESLLLRTGWSRHVGSPQHYRDNFPRIADDLAHWCVEKQVNLLGVEPPSVADVNNMEELTRIHKILLGANVTIVEGLTNLDSLTDERVFFVAAPLKLEGGDGCPCRAFAMIGRS